MNAGETAAQVNNLTANVSKYNMIKIFYKVIYNELLLVVYLMVGRC